MLDNGIIIITQPIQTGKTTALMYRISRSKFCDGILTPDIDGSRKLLMIREKLLVDFQTNKEEESINVGKFHFAKSAFQHATDYLKNIKPHAGSEIIIDEIGKLELMKEGFHQALLYHLDLVRCKESEHRLVLVVRDSLLEQVKSAYGLQGVTTASIIEFMPEYRGLQNLRLQGIVLCGGKSTRMGKDKAFLHYHQKEQYWYVTELFTTIDIPVLISCNKHQKEKFAELNNVVVDHPNYGNSGPISGLLSVHRQKPDYDYILAGCDYPLLKAKHLKMLKDLSRYGFEAVCFVRATQQNVNEPLLTYYSNVFIEKLHNSFQSGNTSIRKILDDAHLLRIVAEEDSFLKSFDTPEDVQTFYQQ